MRSAGTDSHVPHTGITRFDDGLTPVPSAALSVPDADQLARLLARGSTTVKVALDCGWDGTATSYNVIGEISGRSLPKEVVVIGGHLDSWDLGTGAVDDGAGVGITMAAGHLIGQLKQAPKRTIRVIAFANEEQGLYGGKAMPRHTPRTWPCTSWPPRATSAQAASMPSILVHRIRKAHVKRRSRLPK